MVHFGTTEDLLDLALAAELQAALLPKLCPTGCPHQAAAARNRMCGTVGGDFYDFIRINRDQIALVVGDVVGHGVRAALLMGQIMGFLRSEPEKRSRPLQVVQALNEMLLDLGDRTGSVMPCSMFYAVIDGPSGICFFVNAGHPRPLLCDRRTGRVRALGEHDLLLGVEPYQPKEMCHTFTADERMLLYTDGILDAVNEDKECFGPQRLRSVIADCPRCGPEQLAEAVFRTIDEFRGEAPQQDDETVVVVDRL